MITTLLLMWLVLSMLIAPLITTSDDAGDWLFDNLDGYPLTFLLLPSFTLIFVFLSITAVFGAGEELTIKGNLKYLYKEFLTTMTDLWEHKAGD